MHVVIAGAGLGGAALARMLRDRHRVTLLERDPSMDWRGQGVALGLRRSTGLNALERMGLVGEVEAKGLPMGRFVFYDQGGRKLLALEPEPSNAFYTLSVERALLRVALLRGLDVKWGVGVEGYVQGGDGVTVRTSAGLIEADLLVGCDGVGSAVRRVTHGGDRHYLGLVSASAVVELRSSAASMASGAFMMLGQGCSFYAQRFGDEDRALWSFTRRCETPVWPTPHALNDVLAAVRDWPDPAAQLVRAAEACEVRAYYDRAPLSAWDQPRVALLGDAAHPMSPFQGQGGNLALLDAVDLSERLLRLDDEPTQAELREALADYHATMLPRGRDAVLASRRAAQVFHWESGGARALRDAGLWLVGRGLSRRQGSA